MHCVLQVLVTSKSHEVILDPPESESIAAMATDWCIETEVTSASVNLAKAPCKYACAKNIQLVIH